MSKQKNKKKDLLPAGSGKRIAWIDAAKGLAILAIVAGHCADKNGPDNILLHVSMFLGVGAFFLLSGMTFCWKSGDFLDFDARPFGIFAKKLWKTLIFPYFFWGTVSIGIYGVLGRRVAEKLGSDRSHFAIGQNLLGMLYGNSGTGYMEWNRPLWFLVCLVCVELLWYGVLRALYRLPEGLSRQLTKSVYGGMMVLPLFWLIGLNLAGVHLRLPWELETAICVLPCFGAGRLLRIRMERRGGEPLIRRPVWKCVIGILCIAALWMLLAGTAEADFRADRFSQPFLVLPELILGAAGTLELAQLFSESRFLSYIGERTMAILVMHKFAIMGLKLLLRGKAMSLPATIAMDLGMAAVAVLACLAAEHVIGRICPAVFGKTRRDNR